MIYTIVLLLLLLCMALYKHSATNQKGTRRWIMIIMFLALAVLSACRYEDGVHADFYKNYINTIGAGRLTWSAALTFSKEFLHTILRKAIMSVFHDPQAYFFITAFFIVGVFFLTYKEYSPDFPLSILAFYCTYGYFTSNNITRQYIAIALTMLAWRYIIKRKPIPFAILVLLAVGFHVSAVIVIPLYFLASKRFTQKMLLFYIVVGVAAIALNRQVTAFMQNLLYSGYGDGYGSESSNPLRLIWTALTIAALWLLSKQPPGRPCAVLENDEQNLRFRGIIMHGSILCCFFQLLSAVNMLMFTRVAAYFSGCAVLAILYAVETMKLPQNRKVLKTAFALLLIAWFAVMNYTERLCPAHYMAFWQASWRPK